MVNGSTLFWIGSYTVAPSQNLGITQVQLNTQTGSLSLMESVFSLPNPSYLAVTQQGLYSISEMTHQAGSHVFFAQQGQSYRFENQGDYPCHLDVKQSHLAVANYGSGDVLVYKLNEKGVPIALLTRLYQAGQGANPDRQNAPHAHQAVFLKHSDQLAVVDLGTDRLHFYSYQGDEFSATPEQSLHLAAGCGPRHLVFNQAEDRAYVVCELSETVEILHKKDQWQWVQSLALYPAKVSQQAAGAIRLSSDEKHLYVSARAQNQIVVFDVNEQGLVHKAAIDCGGQFPRDMNLSPDGCWLVVANQHSNNLVSFQRDLNTGLLTSKASLDKLDVPVCVMPA